MSTPRPLCMAKYFSLNSYNTCLLELGHEGRHSCYATDSSEGVAAPLEPPKSIDFANQLMGVLNDLYGHTFDILGEQAIVHALDSFAAAVSKNLTKRSMTWGDLPEAVRVLCGNLKPPVQPHEWDNMNISEQRDWAVEQLDISEQFLNVERSNHQTSIHLWQKDESRILDLEKEIAALRETK